MTILVLGVIPSPLTPIIENHCLNVIECADPISTEYLRTHSVEFAVRYRYRHIIQKAVIDCLNGNIINLHISLLPWNRGADPNLWSFLEDTPKGVSIHYIDEGIDTGDIVAQKELFFNNDAETLASTYKKLNVEILELFKIYWEPIINGTIDRKKQTQTGSFHKISDKETFQFLIADKGWKTPVGNLVGKALVNSGKRK
ncbi:MAG: formyl transferase [Candidatus Cloacimonetes bacterium]|nr:formyl transferase [Candidatus Cloacimonadota bacterium]